MSESSDGVQEIQKAAEIINSRLVPSPAQAHTENPQRSNGVASFATKNDIPKPFIAQELPEDSANYWRIFSTKKTEYDLLTRKEEPAHLIMTPAGREYVRKHPGFLKKISAGNLPPTWISTTGTGSVVVQPQEFPGAVVKFIRYGEVEGGKELAGRYHERYGLKLPEGVAYHDRMTAVQAATGTDILNQMVFLQKVSMDNQLGIRVVTPFFATRDVLVCEQIQGSSLFEAVQAVMKASTRDQAVELLINFHNKITLPLAEAYHDAYIEHAKKIKGSRLFANNDFALRPDYFDRLNVHDGIPKASQLVNWIVTNASQQEIENIPNLSTEEQINWLKEHLVLIDPFANFANLTPAEMEKHRDIMIKRSTEAPQNMGQGTEKATEGVHARSDTKIAEPDLYELKNTPPVPSPTQAKGTLAPETEMPIRDARDFYLRVLGTPEIPVNPKGMPSRIFLPPAILGQFQQALLDTIDDGTERSQLIFWDGAQHSLNYSKIMVGTKEHVGGDSTSKFVFKAFGGSRDVIAYCHTHPGWSQGFSKRDVAIFSAYPRGSFIDIVGSIFGVDVLCHTKQSSKIPFSSVLRLLWTEYSLAKKGFEGITLRKQAQVLEELGIAYYHWSPQSPDSTIQPGDLTTGVSLTRLTV